MALTSLCLVSKAISAIATPILYHEFPVRDPPATFRFLLTLSTKPYLAAHVRRASFESYHWEGELNWLEHLNLKPEQKPIVNTVCQLFKLKPPPQDATAVSEQQSSLARSEADSPESDVQECTAYYATAVRELFTRAPSLQHFTTMTPAPYEVCDNERDAWRQLAANPSIPASLCILDVGYGHHRGGFCLKDSDDRIGGLTLAAAPRLKCLWIRLCSGVAFISVYPNITTVRLIHSNLSLESLTHLLEHLPALQDFEYHSGGGTIGMERYEEDDEHTPGEATANLASRSLTLRRISLNYFESDRPLEDPIGSFVEFPLLEMLQLNSRDLYARSIPEQVCLVSILPRSLKKLHMMQFCALSECRSLASAAASGQFPLMTNVTFDNVIDLADYPQPGQRQGRITQERDWTSVRDSFPALGIKCTLTSALRQPDADVDEEGLDLTGENERQD